MGALSTGLVGLALWDGLETLGHSTCTMARPSKIYRAMSLRPSVSSTLQRCMWDITDDEVGYGGERSSALSSVEEGGASGDGQSYTARRQVANLSPPGDSPTTAHCELQQPLLQH